MGKTALWRRGRHVPKDDPPPPGTVVYDVLEIGIGTGLSFVHYDRQTRLVGVDVTPAMLQIAARRAAAMDMDVDLRLGDAASLEFADASFDTVVFTYSLCTIPDPPRALKEAHRVLRPGGTLALTEHVRSPNFVARSDQRLLDPLFRRFEADHLLREPLGSVRALGFTVEELERSALGIIERLHATKLRFAMNGRSRKPVQAS